MRERKTILIRRLFNEFIEQLRQALATNGFIVCGAMDVKNPADDPEKNYRILVVDLPRVSSRMKSLGSQGLILPAYIAIRETYAGTLEVSVINATEILAAADGDNAMLYLAIETTGEIDRIVRKLEKEDNTAPDLITSWG